MKFADPIAWEETLLGVRPSSPAWRVVIKAVYGTPLNEAELALFRHLSGGLEPPVGGVDESEVVGGRRGGKSDTIARVAMFEAVHGGHEIALAPGQTGIIPVISPLREQSQEILGYARGLAEHKAVKRHVAKVTGDAIEFKTGIAIKVMTADAVALSGPTVVCAIRDEWAKWPGPESVMPDTEIENSLRPALAPVMGAPRRRLFGITSAYLEEGLAYETEQRWFGKPDAPVLVFRGDTTTFNPNIDRAWLARERLRNERVFLREYGTPETGPVWQPAITTGWFGDAVIEKSVDCGREQTAPAGHHYSVAIDQAFKADRFAIAVAHAEFRPGDLQKFNGFPIGHVDDHKAEPVPVAIVDYAHAWRAPKGGTMSVEERAQDVAAIARLYGTTRVYCDQFAAEPLKIVFARYGIQLEERPWTGSSKPLRFRAVRDGMADGNVRLPDNKELVREFHNIQGRLLRSGGESIEAHRGGDDMVSAAVLALSEAQVSARVDRGPTIHLRSERSDGYRRGSWR